MDLGERNDRIIALRHQGVGPREIARRVEVSPSAVAGVLRRAGLTRPELGTGGRGHGYGLAYKRLAVASAAENGPRHACRVFGICRRALDNWRHQFKAASQ